MSKKPKIDYKTQVEWDPKKLSVEKHTQTHRYIDRHLN